MQNSFCQIVSVLGVDIFTHRKGQLGELLEEALALRMGEIQGQPINHCLYKHTHTWKYTKYNIYITCLTNIMPNSYKAMKIYVCIYVCTLHYDTPSFHNKIMWTKQ